MANKKQVNPKFSKKRLKEALDYRGYTIDTLCKYRNIGRGARQVWRYWNQGEMPMEIIDNIARELNIDPDYIMGNYDLDIAQREEIDRDIGIKFSNDFFNELSKSLKPENFPYRNKDGSSDFSKSIQICELIFDVFHVDEKELDEKWGEAMIGLLDAIELELSKHFDSVTYHPQKTSGSSVEMIIEEFFKGVSL